MRAAAVAKADAGADPGAGFQDARVGPQVDLLVFDGQHHAAVARKSTYPDCSISGASSAMC